MKAGDTLIYGNGKRVEIVNFPAINGAPGVQLRDPDAMFAGDNFKTKADVRQMLKLGIWKIEPKAKEAP